MQKTKTQININDFPRVLHYLFDGATIYDSSSHPTMTTLYSTHGYYIKYAEKGALKKDAELGKLFEDIGMGVAVVHYLSEDKDKYLYDYSMIRLIKGEEEKVTEMELLGAVVSKEKIEKYEQMFKRAGLKLVKAVPRETALSSLVQVLNKDSEITEFAILDLGYKTSKVDIFKEGVYEVTRTIEQGGETVERIVADVLDVDEHVASQYLEMNKDNIQENERCVDVYSSIATEIMRVMNYYAFENRDSLGPMVTVLAVMSLPQT